MNKKIVIIDYGIGNILSIKNAISYHGYDSIVTRDQEEIKSASHVILPGVGAFPAAMNKLQDLNLIECMLELKNNKTYLLGICLGMQLLFTNSEEFELTKGLNLIDGNIVKLNKFSNDFSYKLPNIGWRNCEINPFNNNLDILKKISSTDQFYFVHSYALKNFEKSLNILFSNYGNVKFPAVVNFQNIYGCQFHPEKSGPQGLEIIKLFLEL
jgi:imidazole glycerol-phosphate synthase subunit HisH